jgi:hypothetical protein
LNHATGFFTSLGKETPGFAAFLSLVWANFMQFVDKLIDKDPMTFMTTPIAQRCDAPPSPSVLVMVVNQRSTDSLISS